MLKVFILPLVLMLSVSGFAAEKVYKVKLADVLLHVSAKSSQAKQIKDLGRILNLSEDDKNEFSKLSKQKKLEYAQVSKVTIDGNSFVLENANILKNKSH